MEPNKQVLRLHGYFPKGNSVLKNMSKKDLIEEIRNFEIKYYFDLISLENFTAEYFNLKTKIEYLQEENHSLKMKIDLLKSEGVEK